MVHMNTLEKICWHILIQIGKNMSYYIPNWFKYDVFKYHVSRMTYLDQFWKEFENGGKLKGCHN